MKEETIKLLRETLDKEKWYELPSYGDKFYTINDELFIVSYLYEYNEVFIIIYDENGKLIDMYIEREVLRWRKIEL